MDARKKAAMMRGFQAFINRINTRYQEAYAALARGDYVEAQRILAQLAQSHAKTSMSLRGVLIREGLLREDDK